MKKYLLSILCIAMAAQVSAVSIYINPGHGGYNSNDRNIVTIPYAAGNQAGFWESSANLTKGLYLRDMLQNAGATVYMSRTDNRSGYRDDTSIDSSIGDRPLSTVAREASSKADFFLSIHSNAGNTATSTINYLLLMLTGTSGSSDWGASFKYSEAKTAATTAGQELMENATTVWSSASTRIQSFTSYTVISPSYLTIPGFLSEGEFHDYKPETHRLLNNDYCKLEAYRFLQFFCTHYSTLKKPTTGVVTGEVRDATLKMTDSRYLPAAGKDQYTPLNGAQVRLYNSADQLVATYTCDNNYNGIFAFWDLTPGTYKLTVAAANHASQTKTVTVTAASITTQAFQLAAGSGDGMQQEESSSQMGLLYEQNLTQAPCNALDSKTIRRVLMKGDQMYVLTADGHLFIHNALTGALVREINTTGITGTERNLGDIAFTSDGVLIGCTQDHTVSAGTTKMKVYKWTSDTEAPTLVFESGFSCNMYDASIGRSIAVSGTASNFRLFALGYSLQSAGVRVAQFTYNGSASAIHNNNTTGNTMGDSTLWSTAQLTASPYSNSEFLLDSKTIYPMMIGVNQTSANVFTKQEYNAYTQALFGGTFCTFEGHTLYILPSGQDNVGVAIYDATAGLNNAPLIKTLQPEETLALSATKYMTAGAAVSGNDLIVTLFAQGRGIHRWKLSHTPQQAEETGDVVGPTLKDGVLDKREMRAGWIASVYCLDWPSSSSRGTTTTAATTQKNELSNLLDQMQAERMNAAMLQVRPMADALYQSSYEPWSVYLTGTRGAAPKYDPLDYAVTETHKRGMELHAWVNPYRYSASTATYSSSLDNDIAKTHPDWILNYGSGKTILNPGLPAVRTYIAKVVVDIITRYDVDGIVFDDYFYVNGETTDAMDQAQYNLYGNGMTRANWRRDNVNKMVREVHDSIKAHKPWVRFGIAPAGVAASDASVASKYGVSKCPTGSDWQYNGLYSEPVQWLKDGTIDYISPQVYWKIGHSTNDYTTLSTWWIEVAKQFNRHAFISQSMDAITAAGANEMPNEWNVARSAAAAQQTASGTFVYRMGQVTDNYKSQLINTNSEQALPPAMTWYSAPRLDTVTNLKATGNNLTWAHPTAERFTLYAYPKGGNKTKALSSAAYLVGIVYGKSFDLSKIVNAADQTIAVCPLDRYGNEYNAALYNASTKQEEAAGTKGANIYASQLNMTVSGNTLTFSYLLNEDATDVTIRLLYKGKPVYSKSLGAQSKGTRSGTINTSDITWPDYDGVNHLTWAIQATGRPINAVSKISDDSERYQFYRPFGVAVDNNPESEYFGRVYVTNTKSGTCSGGRATANGLFAYDAALNALNTTAINGGITWSSSSNGNSPFRCSVAEDGRVFICDWSDAHSGIWITPAGGITGLFTQLFSGTRNSDGLVSGVHGSISACYVLGTGSNTRLYTMDEDYMVDGLPYNMLRYDIGTATTWNKAPSAVEYSNYSNGHLTVNNVLNLAPDMRGGWWIMQNRYAETSQNPALIHVKNGVVDYNSGGEQLINNSQNGGLAVNIDGSRIATTGPSQINVWDVTYDTNGHISGINSAVEITTKQITSGLGANSNDVAFDAAGNLYYVSNTSERLVVIGLPKTDNSHITPARSTSIITLPSHTVSFADYDGSVIKTETVIHGASATAPASPSREGYNFSGWDQTFCRIHADMTITATYEAGSNISYRVEHYQENVANDEYTLYETETLSGTTGATVKPAVKQYAGFRSPQQQSGVILADGSLSIRYEYKRNTHTITWRAEYGSIDSTQVFTSGSTKYGAPIIAPVVSKSGYEFAGWNPAVPATMPDEAIELTAQWTPMTNNRVTIYDSIQTPNGTGYTLYATRYAYGTTGDTITVNAADYEHFTAYGNILTKRVAITGKGYNTVYFKYIRSRYKLTWDKNGGNPLQGSYTKDSVRYEAAIVAPETPTREGYFFAGWQPSVPATMPGEDLTLVAQWNANPQTPYTVIHKWQSTEDGRVYSEHERETLYGATGETVTPPVKTYEGFDSPEAKSTTIKANGSSEVIYQYKRHKHMLRWESPAGTLLGTYTPNGDTYFGKAIDQPDSVYRAGYIFLGWDRDIPTTMPDEPLTITALWERRTDIQIIIRDSLQNLDGTYSYFTTRYAQGGPGDTVIIYAADYEHYRPANGADTKKHVIAPAGKNENYFRYQLNTNTLTWKPNQGKITSAGYTSGSIRYGAEIVAPEVSRTGYNFVGWQPAVPATMPDEPLELTAQWQVITYTVQFVDMYGNLILSREVEYNKTAVAPTQDMIPLVEGMHFVGWDEPLTNILSNKTIQAQYAINRYEVDFFSGSTLLKTDSVNHGMSATAPAEPEQEGYDFLGWDSDFSAVVSDMVINAVWQQQTFLVTYYLLPDSIYAQMRVGYGDDADTPDDPQREGYDFVGWSSDGTDITQHTAIYAIWEESEEDPSPSTALDETMIGAHIMVEGHTLTVTCATSTDIRLYHVGGQLITQTQDDMLQRQLTAGVYLVLVGNQLNKIEIR